MEWPGRVFWRNPRAILTCREEKQASGDVGRKNSSPRGGAEWSPWPCRSHMKNDFWGSWILHLIIVLIVRMLQDSGPLPAPEMALWWRYCQASWSPSGLCQRLSVLQCLGLFLKIWNKNSVRLVPITSSISSPAGKEMRNHYRHI